MHRRVFIGAVGLTVLAGCADADVGDDGETDEGSDRDDENGSGADDAIEFEEVDDGAAEVETPDDESDDGEETDDSEADDDEREGDDPDEETGEAEDVEEEEEEEEETHTVTVTVVDHPSGEQVEGATVRLEDAGTGSVVAEGTTDSGGSVALDVSTGEYLLHADAEGYVDDGTETSVEVDGDTEAERSVSSEDGEEGDERDDETEEADVEVGDVLEVAGFEVAVDSPEEEYVALANTGEEPLDLTGHELWDREEGVVASDGDPEAPYVFPEFVLDGNATVRIWTGSGGDDAENLYWGESTQVWNREGDTVRLFDPEGTLVFERDVLR
ncbi:lamin tail domain-containing protein [Natronorarus salvus]|uniref:lamin tail domain-containing protein n=1 Tax=Natronorarus salvus TaxID=3117733 RepID=UPI002F269CBC